MVWQKQARPAAALADRTTRTAIAFRHAASVPTARLPGPDRGALVSGKLPVRLIAAAAGLVVAALSAAPAVAAPGQAGQAGVAGVAGQVVSIAITSVTPTFAGPGGTVTVSGEVTNPASSSLAGLSVQLWSSPIRFATRADMESYLTTQGATGLDSPTGAATSLATVPGHATMPWSLTLRVSQVGMTAFGVYPLAAQLTQGLTQFGAARTLLPFWPGKSESRVLKQVSIAWVWPLIDTPHRTACPALLDDSLAASVAGGGRLGQLLAAGRSAAGLQANLTWAMDPALLSDVYAMTGPHQVGGTATCTGAAARPASPAARAWLAAVRAAAAQQDYFVTPYDDVDVAALAHQGLDTEMANAFLDGQAQAQKILGQAQHPAPGAPGGEGSSGPGLIAWPADGIADYSVLESLAANKVGTVILDSTVMPPSGQVSYTPSAVTTTPDGLGAQLNVLLADTTIEHILSMPSSSIPSFASATSGAPSPPAGAADAAAAAFSREQWFLAETAMIAAEPGPLSARALVVAPPRRWDPGTGVAQSLLNDTNQAPWLHPASLASLVTAAPGQVRRQLPPPRRVNPAELSSSLLRQVRRLSAQIRVFGTILAQPGPRYLSTAIDAAESSAWRGGAAGQRAAEGLLRGLKAHVDAEQQQVTIVHTARVTLGGKSGSVPVSISNHLPGQAIRVQLRVGVATAGRVEIGPFTGDRTPVVVAAGTQKLIKIPVRVAVAGSTTLTLWLATPDGRPLPGSSTHLTVEATQLGTMAIVIIGIALAVFVLTAAGRAFRRGRGPEGADGDDTGDVVDAQDEDPTGLDPACAAPEADTVERERADEYAAKEPDEHASTQGRAERR